MSITCKRVFKTHKTTLILKKKKVFVEIATTTIFTTNIMQCAYKYRGFKLLQETILTLQKGCSALTPLLAAFFLKDSNMFGGNIQCVVESAPNCNAIALLKSPKPTITHHKLIFKTLWTLHWQQDSSLCLLLPRCTNTAIHTTSSQLHI